MIDSPGLVGLVVCEVLPWLRQSGGPAEGRGWGMSERPASTLSRRALASGSPDASLLLGKGARRRYSALGRESERERERKRVFEYCKSLDDGK